jgi:hypothetical protein
MTNEKLAIEKYIESIEADTFAGDISTIINNLVALEEKHSGWVRLSIRVSRADDDCYGFMLYGKRMETDEEYRKRLDNREKAKARAAKAKSTKDRKELELYENLKKKFGGKK